MPGEFEVRLDAGSQARLGVETAPLEAAEVAETTDAIAHVLDVAGLAQLDAEIAAATAAVAASAAEVQRLTVLAGQDESASQRELDAARASAAADRTRLDLARQRLSLEWNTGVVISDAGQRSELLRDVSAGRAALLRVDPLGRGDANGGAIRLRFEGDVPPLETEPVGAAATVDPRLQANAVLVVARGEVSGSLRPGRVLAAEIESDHRVAGVMIPRGALVRADGSTWAYLRLADDEFVRRQVVEPRIRPDGWFVATGFEAGDEVVTQGAGSLLAVERGDESGEDD
jgi:hypothetical protein